MALSDGMGEYTFHYRKDPGYELGFKHGREYERKYGPPREGPNPVLYRIGAEHRRFLEDFGRAPTRVYLGRAEMAQVQWEGSALFPEKPVRLLGLELFEVKDQYHLRVA